MDDGFTLTGDSQKNQIHIGFGNDSISTDAGNDSLVGGSGNDTVAGDTSSDLIVGGDGAGDDIYDGGEGIVTLLYIITNAGITIDLAAAKDEARSNSRDLAGIRVDQLSNIKNTTAGYYDDIITGNSADNLIAGMMGKDVMDGGGGINTVEIASLFSEGQTLPLLTQAGVS